MKNCIRVASQGVEPVYEALREEELPPGDVTIAVEWSTINYKDGLALTGKIPILRDFPIVPGIDLAGRVVSSEDARFKPDDPVVITGCGLGETRSGGYTALSRAPGDFVIPIPPAFTTRQAMSIGTAGFTAMESVIALERQGITPGSGPVLVTGAGGGVGSLAVSILAKLGYTVMASTGREEIAAWLRELGASEIVARSELSEPGKPLGPESWAAAIDVVGSHTLANVLARTRARGVVAACGLAQGMDLPMSVAPFILRGVTLVGIDSVLTPTREERVEIWNRLASDLDTGVIDAVVEEIGLSEVIDRAPDVLAGKIRGRVVVDVGR